MNPKTMVPFALAIFLVAAGAFFMLRSEPAGQTPEGDAEVVVYKAPTCGCCGAWIEHLEEEGLTVAAVDIPGYEDMARKKREHGVPDDLGSCHTAVVAGYTVEGHVPAHVIQRMVRERPDIRGIAVPGMPIGSPGMEGPNPQPYDVFAFGRDGSRTVYESIYPTSENR